jgi:two-component system LytT family sensor kinase
MKFFPETSPIRKILLSRIAYHIYFWVFLFLLVFVTPGKEGTTFLMKVMSGMRIVGMGLFPVYFHFFVFERYFSKKKFALYAGLLIPALILYIVLFRQFVALVFNEEMDFFSFAILTFFLILFTTSIKVLKRSINERFLFQEVKAKQVQTELELLKAQINPHFLFNTLNNLYGMARKMDKGTADGIAGLSHLMRYMIHDSKADKIQLDKEVEQIQRLIDLQMLRFAEEDNIDIDFQVEGDVKNVLVPPMLMIPFVENAFKHGIALSAPSFVHIHLKAANTQVLFQVQNSLHSQKSEKPDSDSGLGLQNVRRRLELLFPDAHDLSIRITPGTYDVELRFKMGKKPNP